MRPLDIPVAAGLRVGRVPDIVQEAPNLLQIVSGVVLQSSAVPPGLPAVPRKIVLTRLKLILY